MALAIATAGVIKSHEHVVGQAIKNLSCARLKNLAHDHPTRQLDLIFWARLGSHAGLGGFLVHFIV